MDEGYIKLHRSIEDSRVWQNEGLLKVWLWCLLRANYKERWVSVQVGKGSTEVHVMPGQFIFGRDSAATRLKMKPSTVNDRLKKLEKMQNIDIQSNKQFSIITIINWGTYQDNETHTQQPNQQPSDNQPTTNQQPSDTDKKDKKVKKEKKETHTPSLWPDDFTLTDHLRELAAKYIPADKIDLEWEAFQAYSVSNGKKYTDWDAAWKTRYTNYARFNKTSPRKGSAREDDLLKEFD